MRRNLLPLIGTASVARAMYRHKYCVTLAVVAFAFYTNIQYACFERPAHEAVEIARALSPITQRLNDHQRQVQFVTDSLALHSQPGYVIAQAKNLAAETKATRELAEDAYLAAKRASNAGLPVDKRAIDDCYAAIMDYSQVSFGLHARIATIECEASLVRLEALVAKEEEKQPADGLLLMAAYPLGAAMTVVSSPGSLVVMHTPDDIRLAKELKEVEAVINDLDRRPFLSKKQLVFYQGLLDELQQKVKKLHPAPATPPVELLASRSQFPA